MSELTPEQELAWTRAWLFARLSVLATLEMVIIGLSSMDEQTEEWALRSLRDYSDMLRSRMEEPNYQTTSKMVADLLSKL